MDGILIHPSKMESQRFLSIMLVVMAVLGGVFTGASINELAVKHIKQGVFWVFLIGGLLVAIGSFTSAFYLEKSGFLTY